MSLIYKHKGKQIFLTVSILCALFSESHNFLLSLHQKSSHLQLFAHVLWLWHKLVWNDFSFCWQQVETPFFLGAATFYSAQLIVELKQNMVTLDWQKQEDTGCPEVQATKLVSSVRTLKPTRFHSLIHMFSIRMTATQR